MSTTPTDPTQDPILASAYLDGEATPDERALVETSPELFAEVERLRRVRGVLAADVEPAPVSVREAHLAAALDVYDQLNAGSNVAPLAAAAARRSRRRERSASGGQGMRTVLGVAAGLVVLAGAGAVIRGVIVGNDDDAPIADEAAVSADDEAAELGPSGEDIAAEVAGDNTNDAPPTEIDETEVARDVLESEAAEFADEPAEEPAEEPMAAAEEADTADVAAAFPVDDDPTGGADAESFPEAEDPPAEVDLVTLVTPQDLADLAAPAAYEAGPIGDADEDVDAGFDVTACAEERPIGLGIDRFAEFVVVAGEVVSVGIDLDDGVAYAFRDDCTVVLDAVLPSEDEYRAGRTVPTTTVAP